jgi:hypothetical protein
MESNHAQVQTRNGHSPTTLKERKLIVIEKQMRKRREKAIKVGNKLSGCFLQAINIYGNRTIGLQHQASKQRKGILVQMRRTQKISLLWAG